MTIARAGFAVLPRALPDAVLASVREAVVEAVARAIPGEVHVGSTSVRVNGILGQVPALAALLNHPPLLDAAASIVGGPYRLSSLHARSVKPGAGAQALHQDVATGAEAWPLAGFILMLDPFTLRSGATRFVPGSRDLAGLPAVQRHHRQRAVHACGAAGSLIVFDGSTWHGHGANTTGGWRHSVQGAFIPRAATPTVDFGLALPAAGRDALSARALQVL